MSTVKPERSRRALLIGGAVLALLLMGGGLWFFFLRSEEKKPLPPLLTYQEGALLYSFHVPTGSEELYDLEADPSRRDNLAVKRAEDTARLRQLLTKKLGVKDLEDLRKGKVIDALTGLGYM
jgi:hypothetical protein